MMERNRLMYIDIAKGFAIFLMVVGHSYTYALNNGAQIIRWLYSFHMPLFFIASGVLYGLRDRQGSPVKWNLRKKAKTILLPYLIWSTVYQMFLSLLAIIGGKPAKETLLYYLLMVPGLTGTAMWFLPSMFLATGLFFLCYSAKKYSKMLPCLAGALLMAAGIFAPEVGSVLPIVLRACVGTGFMTIGFYGAKLFDQKTQLAGVVALATVHLFLTWQNETVSLAARSFSNPILYVCNSCIGTLCIFWVAQSLQPEWLVSGTLAYWGRNSIKILCFHEFLLQVLRIVDFKWFGEILPTLGSAEGIVLAVLIMLLLTMAMPVINRVLYWSFGLKRQE